MPERQLPMLSVTIAAATSVLSRAGVASPRVDAELLAAHVLDVPRARLLTAAPFDAAQAAEFDRLVGLRAERVPLQHLTGSAPFYGLDLAVGPGVFIPRFETELLVEWALDAGGAPGTVVDLCSGSGAIAVTVARALPGVEVFAVEAAPPALDWLRRNVDRLAPGVHVVAGDATDAAVLSDLDGTVDLLLCNPPYVPQGAPVDVEVRDHDPHNAVFAGADGLDLIPGIARRAAALLRPGGLLGIEHDDTQGTAVPELLRQHGFTAVIDHRDLAGRPRFVTAIKPASKSASKPIR